MPTDYEKLPTYPIVPLTVPFADARGVIQNVVTDGVASVVVISSKKGSERASHWHREDDHLCLLLSGGLDYYWVHYGAGGGPPLHEVRKVTVKPGEAFYTPNNCGHTMYFTEDSTFLTLSRRSRVPEKYEEDLVRIASLRPPTPTPAKTPESRATETVKPKAKNK